MRASLITWQKIKKKTHNSGQLAEKHTTLQRSDGSAIWSKFATAATLRSVSSSCQPKSSPQHSWIWHWKAGKKVFKKIDGPIVEVTWRKCLVLLVRVLASHQCISQTHIPNWPLLIPSYHAFDPLSYHHTILFPIWYRLVTPFWVAIRTCSIFPLSIPCIS